MPMTELEIQELLAEDARKRLGSLFDWLSLTDEHLRIIWGDIQTILLCRIMRKEGKFYQEVVEALYKEYRLS